MLSQNQLIMQSTQPQQPQKPQRSSTPRQAEHIVTRIKLNPDYNTSKQALPNWLVLSSRPTLQFQDHATVAPTPGATVPAVPVVPVVQQTPNYIEQIKQQLDAYEYPITAAFIRRNMSKTKKFINPILYRMSTDGLIEKLDCVPPLWRRV